MRRLSIGTRISAWVLGTSLALAVSDDALAAGCRVEAISSRFVEAARLCGKTGDSSAAPAAMPAPTHTKAAGDAVVERSAVSVSMPSTRRSRGGVAYATRRGRPALPSRAVASHAALVVAVAQRYRINPRLLASMMRTESNGNPNAVSSKGALGLMQVMPGTARSLGISQPRAMLGNPVLAMAAGAAYLKKLQRQIGNNVPLVVAAYNAGPGAVMRAKRRVPRYRETQGYVRSVMGGFAQNRRQGAMQ